MMHISRQQDPASPINEIDEYQDMRSIGASEACWRLFGYPLFVRKPAVYALRVHLPDQQVVYFRDGEERQAAHPNSRQRQTELTEFS